MAKPAGRSSRNNETRDSDTRANNVRQMPQSRHVSKLYVPPEEIPEGMAYSWIAVEQMQVPDFTRADEQSAKGWVPVPRARHARFRHASSLIPGRAETDPYAQFVKVGGLLLCERPKEDVDADKMQQVVRTNDSIKSISRWRSGEGADPTMPRFDESSDAERAHAARFKS